MGLGRIFSLMLILAGIASAQVSVPAGTWMGWAYNLGKWESGSGYDYTRQHLSGFMIHQVNVGFYNTLGALDSVLNVFVDQKTPIHLEMPGPVYDTTKGPITVAFGTAQGSSWASSRLGKVPNGRGDSVRIINVDAWDPQPSITAFKKHYPTLSDSAALDSAVCVLLAYMQRVSQLYPNVSYSVITAFPLFAWKTWPGVVATVNKQSPALDFYPVMKRVIELAKAKGVKLEGWTADNPVNYYSMVPSLDWWSAMLDIQAYVQSHGLSFTIISNIEPKNTQDFFTGSMRYVRTFQLKGGRANRYIVESWYTQAPVADSMVPESLPYSGADLTKTMLTYLQGVGQTLNLSAREGSGAFSTGNLQYSAAAAVSKSYALQLRNAGTAYCLPLLKLTWNNVSGTQIAVKYGTQDITSIVSTTGWSPTDTLSAGDSLLLTVTVQGNAIAAGGVAPKISLLAYWNPQQPDPQAKDTLTITGLVAALSSSSSALVSSSSKMSSSSSMVSSSSSKISSSSAISTTAMLESTSISNRSFQILIYDLLGHQVGVGDQALKNLPQGTWILVRMTSIGRQVGLHRVN